MKSNHNINDAYLNQLTPETRVDTPKRRYYVGLFEHLMNYSNYKPEVLIQFLNSVYGDALARATENVYPQYYEIDAAVVRILNSYSKMPNEYFIQRYRIPAEYAQMPLIEALILMGTQA